MKKIIFFSILVVVLAAFFASSHPDGLEKVAQDLGFIERGVERTSLMTDYTIPFISQERVSASLAGIIGVFITLGLFWGIGAILNKRPL